jgi:hypothetical protein
VVLPLEELFGEEAMDISGRLDSEETDSVNVSVRFKEQGAIQMDRNSH